jgi:hypothetical protein
MIYSLAKLQKKQKVKYAKGDIVGFSLVPKLPIFNQILANEKHFELFSPFIHSVPAGGSDLEPDMVG